MSRQAESRQTVKTALAGRAVKAAACRRQAAYLRGVEQHHPLLGGQGDEQVHHINAPAQHLEAGTVQACAAVGSLSRAGRHRDHLAEHS